MTVLSGTEVTPRDDRAEHAHPSGWKRPSTTEPHIGFFFLNNTTENITFCSWKELKRIYVVCLGKNTRVRTEVLSQAKTTDFLIWCARNMHSIASRRNTVWLQEYFITTDKRLKLRSVVVKGFPNFNIHVFWMLYKYQFNLYSCWTAINKTAMVWKMTD